MNSENEKIIKQSLKYHRNFPPGKIKISPSKKYNNRKYLSLAYSPGVAAPCNAIKKNKLDAYTYTSKGNLVGVISNGTAVLGLGNIGALAAKPVMEGKALLFKIFAGINAFDIEINENDPDKFIEIVRAISPTFGGINLEDIKSPEAFKIEQKLKKNIAIPIMHDDQHGTAIISGAALLNALFLTNKDINKIKLVLNGAGSAAISCGRIYKKLGVKKENIIMCDSMGVINTSRNNINEEKKEFITNEKITSLEEAIKGADVFIGLSIGNVLTQDMLKNMNKNPIIFALANPIPEIDYNLAKNTRSDIIIATGRSDYPNQVNNVLGFPYIFRGALDVRATTINEKMKIAAINSLAELARKPITKKIKKIYKKNIEFGKEYIIPNPFDDRLICDVSISVAKAAIESGVSTKNIHNWELYRIELKKRIKNIN